MPPCSDDQLTISLDDKDLVITALAKDSPSHVTCEHRFRLSFGCTIAGANWDKGNLFIELICADIPAEKTPNQLVAKYSGTGSWLQSRQNGDNPAGAPSPRAA